jgi:TolA-binding protein
VRPARPGAGVAAAGSASSSKGWRERLRTLQAALKANQQLQQRMRQMLASVEEVRVCVRACASWWH